MVVALRLYGNGEAIGAYYLPGQQDGASAVLKHHIIVEFIRCCLVVLLDVDIVWGAIVVTDLDVPIFGWHILTLLEVNPLDASSIYMDGRGVVILTATAIGFKLNSPDATVWSSKHVIALTDTAV